MVVKDSSSLTPATTSQTLTYNAGGTISVTVVGGFTGTGIALPTGDISYTIGSGSAQIAAITDGTATVTIPASQAAGPYTITVNYAGDGNYNAASPATISLEIDKATATVMLGSLSATYDGNPHAATSTTTPASLAVTFTYDGSSTAPTAAGSYAVIGTINNANYTGTATGALVIAKAATVMLGSLSATYDGNPHAVTATTTPASLAVTFTYNGSSAAPTAAGSYPAIGTINDSNYAGTASGTLVIAKATATVTLGNLSAVYDGNPHAATATTSPSSLTVLLTYDGSSTAPTAAGSYAVIGTIGNANYAGTASGTLIIAKATAIVTLGTLSATYDGNPHAATATTNPASLAASFTYNGSSTAPTVAGSYAVIGTISDANYAGTASGTLVIAKAAATVTLGNLTATYDGNPHAATATTNPASLAVALTYNGSATAPTAAGSYPVVGTINDTNHSGSATGTLVIAKATPAVAWNAPAAIPYGTSLSSTQLNATANVAGSFAYNPASGTVLAAGPNMLSVTFTPTDTTDYTTATASVSLTVNQHASSSITVVSSTGSSTPGQTVTFTATVSPASATGTVSFYDGATLLGTTALSAGVATYSTAALAPGVTHIITAAYGGDASYVSSTTALTVSVVVAPLDFTPSAAGPALQAVIPGNTASFVYQISPVYGAYPGTVSLAVSGLPPGLEYTLSRNTFAANAGPQTVTLTIHTKGVTAENKGSNSSGDQKLPWSLAFLLLPFAASVRMRRSPHSFAKSILVVLFLLAGIGMMTGCASYNGFFGAAPHSYTITMTATSGSIQHTTVTTLTVR